MSFANRQPSLAWELLVLPDLPGCQVWAWFKPAHDPQQVLFQIPDEMLRTFGTMLTLRRLLPATGIEAAQAESWTVLGMTYAVQGGANPLLDQPVPHVGPAGIVVRMLGTSTAMLVPMPAPISPAVPAAGAGAQFMLEAIDAEWQSIIQIERQLDAVRRQLGAVQGQLQSLNRDLDSDERMFADNHDKKEWQDARRWLRDAFAQVSKLIRAHDIGMTSSAGNRRRFESIFREYIEPRRPFPGLEAEQFAFEQHRKTSQTLLVQMQSTHSTAARDGVQRASMVLSRIAAKVRTGRAKR